MKRVGRWLKIIGITLFGLLVVGATVLYAASQSVINRTYQPTPVQLPAPDPALLADGKRQAKLLGCASCHGPDMQGKVVADIALVARIEAPNLLAAVQGRSDQQLAQAIRQGIARNGKALWVMPALPRMRDAELSALIWWLRGLPNSNKPSGGVSFGPVGRVAILSGGFRPVASVVNGPDDRPPVDLGPEHERGRYLAATVCAQCHGFMLQGVKMEDGSVSPDLVVTAAYDLEQFRTLLRTGTGIGGRELGLMSVNARDSFSAFHDEEIDALYGYLKARAAAPPQR
jgi:mono/diheme cytochrome c family protein